MLDAIIPSRTRVNLLTLFLLNPDSAYYVREIVRITGDNINSVRRELSNLESFGLLVGEKRGVQQYYLVNKEFFLYPELQRMIIKSVGVAGVIRENLRSLGEIRCAFIYGSFAKGSAGSKSDIDLFLIGDVDEETLIVLISECEQIVLREINYTLMIPSEFTKRRENHDPFVTHVLNEEKIVLIGACDD